MTPCEVYENVTICRPGKTEIIKTEREDNRWCFGCRKRGGTWELHMEIEPSYYEPMWLFRCDSCHKDRTWFGCGA